MPQDVACYDVVVVGAGPTGLTLANLLGRMGVSVALLERNATTVQEPRAVSIDDESMRTMQAAGLAEAVQAITARGYGSDYKGPDGRIFASVMPVARDYGFDKRNAFEQPALEALLREGLGRFACVTALFCHAVTDVAQDDDGVTVTAIRDDQVTIVLRARYLVACDGGRSPIRKALGITLEGSTFEEPWLIVDLERTMNRNRHTEVFCDPERPTISLPGPAGIRRYEFMLRKGEDPAAVIAEPFVRGLMARIGPDRDAPIRRARVYTFHARLAARWRVGRIFLAGDAAHLTPPFAGQGMNSGLRDAHNLAWKLAEAVRMRDPVARETVLDSYEIERKPHAGAMIALAMRLGEVMMPRSRLRGALTRAGFRSLGLWGPARDYVMHMKYKPKPRFQRGLVWPAQAIDPGGVVGAMLPQPEVETIARARRLLDDVLPDAPVVLVYHGEPDRLVTADALAAFRDAGAAVVGLTPEGVNPVPAAFPILRDAGRLLSMPAKRSLAGMALLLRRDRYVAAMAPVEDAAALMAPLAAIRAV